MIFTFHTHEICIWRVFICIFCRVPKNAQYTFDIKKVVFFLENGYLGSLAAFIILVLNILLQLKTFSRREV